MLNISLSDIIYLFYTEKIIIMNQEISPKIFNLKDNKYYDNLSGKILIASPFCKLNDMFKRSLIYIISHSKDGAMGLIINQIITTNASTKPFTQFASSKAFEDIETSYASIKSNSIFIGGPVSTERGFVIHSNDYSKNLLCTFPNQVSVSSNLEIFQDIATGNGPKQNLLLMGYTGWEKGQLEKEIENNFWIISSCSKDLIFLENNEEKWNLALTEAGIHEEFFAPHAARC